MSSGELTSLLAKRKNSNEKNTVSDLFSSQPKKMKEI